MGITKEEANAIRKEFYAVFRNMDDDSKPTAQRCYAAWEKIWAIMEREQNYTEKLGDPMIEKELSNWANDSMDLLNNAQLFEETRTFCEYLIKITWGNVNNQLMHENAKREIADTYLYEGSCEKSIQLYEEYLAEDPQWGWGWIGYFRALSECDKARFEKTLNDLYEKLTNGSDFRDKEDLVDEVSQELADLGQKDKSKALKKLSR